HREGLLPAKPVGIVLKIDRPARLPVQPPHKAAVQKDVERNPCPAARHQNRSSILSVEAFVRGRTTTSMSSAVRTSNSVRSVPDPPLSPAEIVPRRKLVLPAISFCVMPRERRRRRSASPTCFGFLAI